MPRPRHIAALVSALQFRDPNPELLSKLSQAEWQRLLVFSDFAHLTLILGNTCSAYLPAWVQKRLATNLTDNTERWARIQCEYARIAEALERVGTEHIVLKGFAQWPHFVSDPRLRLQSDLDLYCPAYSLSCARKALLGIGYEQMPSPEERNIPSDHLPAFVVPGRQRWRGNSFDPDLGLAVELHYQFWDPVQTRFGPENLEMFWNRRRVRTINGIRFDALDPVDAFAHSALHALRHLLYGGLLPSHIYEIAFFLHHNSTNSWIWRLWLSRHDDRLRRLTAICSLLAVQWFGCSMPATVQDEARSLPSVVSRWFEKFGDSALADPLRFNKHAVWLHLGLIDSSRERHSVLRRRLFPLWVPPLDSRWVQDGYEIGRKDRRGLLKKCLKYADWFAVRVVRHLSVLPSTLWAGLRLWAS